MGERGPRALERLAELAEEKENRAKTVRKQLAKDSRAAAGESLASTVAIIGAMETEAAQFYQFGDLLSEGNPPALLIRAAAKQAAEGLLEQGQLRPDRPGERIGLTRAAHDIIDVLTRIEN